jgi:SPP1 gp7 family putative phage head morphogenesis protein
LIGGGSVAEWKLADAEKIRENLTKEQENEISNLYRKVYLDSRKQMLAIPKEGTTSQQIEKQYLSKLTKQLDEAYKSLGTGLEKEIKKQAEKAAEGVVSDANKFTSKLGFSVEGSYSTVSKDVVNSLVTGQVYGGNWSLSGAVWSNVSKAQSDISKIVAEGVAGNKSAYEIAKSLETYVNPSAKKEWNWSKVYPGTSKKVEYNAQRLARTLVAHAYQQSLERVCKKNPFVDGYIWQSGGGPRTCPICADRNGKKYAKGDLPLDHPNGRCTFIADLTGSMDDVASRLADWVQGKDDPELDEWCTDLGYKMNTYAENKNAPIADTKSLGYDYMSAIKGYDPNIIGMEEGHPIGFNSDLARKYGITEAQYNKNVEKWNKFIQKQVETGVPSMQVNQNSLTGMLQSGGFKTVWETGLTDWKTGMDDYLKYRLDVEKTMFGVTDPAKGAPTYLYMNTGQQIREEYGDIRIVFKRSILDNSTLTVGDSMEGRCKPFTVGEKLTEENLRWNQAYDSTASKKTMDRYAEYIEVQCHSKVTTSDIEEVVLPKKHDSSIEEALNNAGINWRVGK